MTLLFSTFISGLEREWTGTFSGLTEVEQSKPELPKGAAGVSFGTGCWGELRSDVIQC